MKQHSERYLVSEVSSITVDNEYRENFTDSEMAEGLANAFRLMCELSNADMTTIKLRVMDIHKEKYIVDAGGKQYILRRLH